MPRPGYARLLPPKGLHWGPCPPLPSLGTATLGTVHQVLWASLSLCPEMLVEEGARV